MSKKDPHNRTRSEIFKEVERGSGKYILMKKEDYNGLIIGVFFVGFIVGLLLTLLLS